MAGSSFGTILRLTTWGESHGSGVGAVLDGCPAGIPLEEADIQTYLDRRKPGQSRFTTPRKENDTVEILSGVFEGRTTGTPISLLVRNENQRSRDYSEIAQYYRPGHADYPFEKKYGFRDYRGGGRSSGRETIGRVAAGAVAVRLLSELGIHLFAYTRSIGNISIDPERYNPAERDRNPLFMPDPEAAVQAQEYAAGCQAAGDSCGGVVECTITGLPAGLGDPVFEKIDANLAKAILSIGAVKGFEIGDGFAAARATGSSNNDPFRSTRESCSVSGAVHMDKSDVSVPGAVHMDKSDVSVSGAVCMDKSDVSVSGAVCMDKSDVSVSGAVCMDKSDVSVSGAVHMDNSDVSDEACPVDSVFSTSDAVHKGGHGITKSSNHAGGTLGGMTDGSTLVFRAAFKPTPSISIPQQTVNRQREEITISIGGRHDPVIVPRAVVVVESMAALVIADALLMNMSSRMDRIRLFYSSIDH